jgi:hypothetical protein
MFSNVTPKIQRSSSRRNIFNTPIIQRPSIRRNIFKTSINKKDRISNILLRKALLSQKARRFHEIQFKHKLNKQSQKKTQNSRNKIVDKVRQAQKNQKSRKLGMKTLNRISHQNKTKIEKEHERIRKDQEEKLFMDYHLQNSIYKKNPDNIPITDNNLDELLRIRQYHLRKDQEENQFMDHRLQNSIYTQNPDNIPISDNNLDKLLRIRQYHLKKDQEEKRNSIYTQNPDNIPISDNNLDKLLRIRRERLLY